MARCRCLRLLLFHLCALLSAGDALEELKRDLQAIIEERAQTYNCSFSVAIKLPALGATLAFASKDITPDTRFAWGSVTKMWTGAAVMQLAAKGAFSLDEPMAPIVDAQLAAMKAGPFPAMNFTKLSDLYGPDVEKVRIRDLLAMQSGIPDFDTANPNAGNLDPFRATVYAHPDRDYSVPTLMSLPWVAKHKLISTPGSGFHYSTTNFELLGLILANHAGVADYRDLNQSFFIPDSLAEFAKKITWAKRGTPRDNKATPGYDRTIYNHQQPNVSGGVPVVDVHGVFAGWSGADFVGSPTVVAELGYALWGKPAAIVPEAFRDQMIPHRFGFYGLASQNVGLMGITGNMLSRTYGHLGATYGYDSIFGYSHDLELGIAIATNIETPSQTQPSDAFCHVFNRVKNYIEAKPAERCVWTTRSYYQGSCRCAPDPSVAETQSIVV